MVKMDNMINYKKVWCMRGFVMVMAGIWMLAYPLQGQDTLRMIHQKVQLISKHEGSRIILRWAPADAKWWYHGIQDGFSIARREVTDPNSRYVTLVDTLLPWTAERIESHITDHPDDNALILPLQTIHRDWENTQFESADFGDMYERSQYFEQRFHTTVLAADIYPVVADAAGLRFVDEDIDPDKTYSYRVRYNYSGLHQAYSVVRQWFIIDRPFIHEIIEKENAVSLKWDRELHGKEYTAYYIERSKDGVHYERLNTLPYVQGVSDDMPEQPYIIYTDEVENYELFYYRIVGIDPFGDESEPSEAMVAKGKDRTPPIVNIPIVELSEGGSSNKIKWSHDPIDELKQAIVYKKDYSKTPKIVYESSAESGFDFIVEDNEVMDGMTDYFLVLVDTAGNFAQSQRASLYRKDDVPPLAPINLKADVDTTGRIILSWDQGPDNDIIGYYIYTADRAEDNFIKLNQKKYPYRIYQDSVDMTLLTPKRYYKVAAIDKGGNIGEYSDVLEVNRPDRIPPSPCLFYDYRVDSAGVFLGLVPSSSRDVVEHRLYRRAESEQDFTLIQTFGKRPPQLFWDDKVKSATSYVYKWVAADAGNLESSPDNSTLYITTFDVRTTFVPLIRLESTKDGVLVKVGQNIPGEDYRIQLIRSYKNGKFKTITTLSDTYDYLDSVRIDEDREEPTVTYKAKILYRDGKRSKFSEAASL